MAALWPVKDQRSVDLLTTLHRRLRAGDEPAKALRFAQLQLLTSSDSALRSPATWAVQLWAAEHGPRRRRAPVRAGASSVSHGDQIGSRLAGGNWRPLRLLPPSPSPTGDESWVSTRIAASSDSRSPTPTLSASISSTAAARSSVTIAKATSTSCSACGSCMTQSTRRWPAMPRPRKPRWRAGSNRSNSCNDHLTAIGEALVRTRSELFEREGADRADPLIARDSCFAAIDTDAMYRERLAHGAALPQRVFWDDIATRMRDGGARAGLRVLDRALRELQSEYARSSARSVPCGVCSWRRWRRRCTGPRVRSRRSPGLHSPAHHVLLLQSALRARFAALGACVRGERGAGGHRGVIPSISWRRRWTRRCLRPGESPTRPAVHFEAGECPACYGRASCRPARSRGLRLLRRTRRRARGSGGDRGNRSRSKSQPAMRRGDSRSRCDAGPRPRAPRRACSTPKASSTAPTTLSNSTKLPPATRREAESSRD